MINSNYDKFPAFKVPAAQNWCLSGWDSITGHIASGLAKSGRKKNIVVVECYQGVNDKEILDNLKKAFPKAEIVLSADAMLGEKELNARFGEDITDDEIFGYMTRYNMEHYFSPGKVEKSRARIDKSNSELVIVYGTGACHICPKNDILIYADMARWEIQQRFRCNQVGNIGVDNKNERTSLQYKRAFFVDWRICDRFKHKLMGKWDYVLDTNKAGEPNMTTGAIVNELLAKMVERPFRVVPFFDPGPWGGQWMKDVCDLDRDANNFAWCFDCVPEENSLLFDFGGTLFEIPSINLVFSQPRKLLGEPVHGRFGDEFPIRFDFLDTMEGGNLSLQVHPLTEYIQQKFGMHYTQDESYYMLDAKDDAVVYLGLKNGVNVEEMIADLKNAQKTGEFDVGKYTGVYPAKKHDHFLIPAGTVHCSATNCMVLEISATPFIFTFKLWDWGRLGLDGRPRPINIEHGKNVIQWYRNEDWVKRELINNFTDIAKGDGWFEEKTGLHEREFIETRRHVFTGTVPHKTSDSVNVINLVEGEEVIVESPDNAFEPFVVHYAETFIVPENVKKYTIRPYGKSEGKRCATIKAFVRNHA